MDPQVLVVSRALKISPEWYHSSCDGVPRHKKCFQCYYPVRACAAGSSDWSCPYICIFVCIFICDQKKRCFTSQSSKNFMLVCLCIYMSPNLSATPGELQIKRYSSVFYLYAHMVSPPRVHGFYLCALIRSAHSSSLQCTAHRVMCSLNSSLKYFKNTKPKQLHSNHSNRIEMKAFMIA